MSRRIPGRVTVVAFDGDDTLWTNEDRFHEARAVLVEMTSGHAAAADLEARLLVTERRNLELFGYGVKGFTLSMIETAIEVGGAAIGAPEVQRLIDLGKRMLAAPVELLAGVGEALAGVAAGGRRPMLITKGDLFDQETRIARSGLADAFWAIEIVSEKDERTYRRVLDRHGVAAAEFCMVGNSIRSDVLPPLAIGGAAVLVPHPLTWAHEQAEPPSGHQRFRQIASLAELPGLL